jgi:hypothetical protein
LQGMACETGARPAGSEHPAGRTRAARVACGGATPGGAWSPCGRCSRWGYCPQGVLTLRSVVTLWAVACGPRPSGGPSSSVGGGGRGSRHPGGFGQPQRLGVAAHLELHRRDDRVDVAGGAVPERPRSGSTGGSSDRPRGTRFWQQNAVRLALRRGRRQQVRGASCADGSCAGEAAQA